MPRTISNPVVREKAYTGRNNAIRLALSTYDPVTDTDTPISWGSVVRMTLCLIDMQGVIVAQINSAVTAGVIDYTANGYVTLNLGIIPNPVIPVGQYLVRLTSVDAGGAKVELISDSHPDQQVRIDIVPTATVA